MANTIDTMAPEAILRGIIDGSLTELVDDVITDLPAGEKFRNSGIKRAVLTGVLSVGNFGMARTSMEYIDLPNCTSLYYNSFRDNSYLEEVHLPKANTRGMEQAIFQDDHKLKMLVLPKHTNNIGGNLAYNCSNLTTVDLALNNFSGSYHFWNCNNLSVMILRKTTGVSAINNLSGFIGNIFTSGGVLSMYPRPLWRLTRLLRTGLLYMVMAINFCQSREASTSITTQTVLRWNKNQQSFRKEVA